MTRLIIPAFIAVALLAAVTTLRLHSISSSEAARTAVMPSVQELQHTIDTAKLPVEEFDDRSMVFPNRPTR